MEPSKGTKHDADKIMYHLIPISFLAGVAKGFMFGMGKYGKWNWRKGLKYTRLIDAALRHIVAFACREEIDEETGLSHLDLAGCNIAMLKAHQVEGLGEDDRCESKTKKERDIDKTGHESS